MSENFRTRRAEMEALGWGLVGVFVLLCLLPGDEQWLGEVGLGVYNTLFVLLGHLSMTVPLACFYVGIARVRQETFGQLRWMGLGYLGCVVSAGMLLASFESAHTMNPGWFGKSAQEELFPFIGQAGVVLLALAGLVLGLYGMEVERPVVRAVQVAGLWIALKGHAAWQVLKGFSILPVVKPVEPAKRTVPQVDLTPVVAVSKTRFADLFGQKASKKEKFQKEKPLKEKVPPPFPKSVSALALPPITLLSVNEARDVDEKDDEQVTREVGALLVETLKNFGIEAKLTHIAPGPVITRYELEPAKGVKVSRFVSLADDIALALKASQIRVVAPIPGKGAVGIEVPNRNWEMVRLRQLLETKNWQKNMLLPVALGKAIDGSPVIFDLTEAPHMLIAGATGSGKSVCINALIMSLLFSRTSEELRLVLIDPKRVEFAMFRDVPHLLTPIITDPRQAAEILKAVIAEMETRYNQLSQAGAQNIAAYNRKVEERPTPEFDQSGVPVGKLPYIVVCIDELAELMLIAAKEVEEAVMRIAQLARGVGIHLVVATQRPSVDVITGVIKANLPVRVAFQVASKVDSRTILDANGADALLGKGDMLFLPAGAPKPIRAQSSFVSREDIEATVQFLKGQQAPQYKDLLASVHQKADAMAESSEDPAVIRSALLFVIERKRVSTMLLQGALHISYGRAANMVSWMEMKNLIGPGVGAKPRDVFLDRIEQWVKAHEPAVKN